MSLQIVLNQTMADEKPLIDQDQFLDYPKNHINLEVAGQNLKIQEEDLTQLSRRRHAAAASQ
jgi:hypothetical protein